MASTVCSTSDTVCRMFSRSVSRICACASASLALFMHANAFVRSSPAIEVARPFHRPSSFRAFFAFSRSPASLALIRSSFTRAFA
ncbi:MAG: hypothetical protein BWY82_00647 [Verrucomicrobia bacterium ADurb.Bin474]|nr:MAG: hypothetical protein BWY82_00647 [Verrucomicrobia bacterium ADurb.Bin474]